MKFVTTAEEWTLVDAIRERAIRDGLIKRTQALHLEMDIIACHLNGCPLDLEGLAKARGTDFVHDVCGIARHLNRNTLKLEDRFFPRSAACYHER